MTRERTTAKAQEWTIHRKTIQQSEGQRRWDLAYQYLLRWSEESNAYLKTQEANHESSDLCAGLDPTPGPEPDH